jgi:hypothetical protein
MNPDVQRQFSSFTERFEGHVDFMYLDVKGLVTIGRGNLIDPVDVAVSLPFVLKSDPATAATREQVAAEWASVKGRTDLKMRGGVAFGAVTKLAITEETLTDLVSRKLSSNVATLKNSFPDFDTWPADAQLGVLSMAWAMGPAFSHMFPHFTQTCLGRDWVGAANNCKMDETGNPGLKPRNAANVVLFGNAGCVDARGLDPQTLYFPRDLRSEQGPVA